MGAKMKILVSSRERRKLGKMLMNQSVMVLTIEDERLPLSTSDRPDQSDFKILIFH